jgi:hypothetical protein
MNDTIDDESGSFNLEQHLVIAHAQTIFWSGIGEVFDVASKIVAHFFDLSQHARRISDERVFRSLRTPGLKAS